MITSKENKTVKELCRLQQKKYRQDHYLILNEEMTLCALKHGFLQQLVYCGDQPFEFAQALQVSSEVLLKISGGKKLAYIGVGRMIEESAAFGKRIIILDQLQDPLNIGRIMEGCLLFGFDTLILSENCADIYNEKCLDHCKGGLYELKIAIRDLETLIPQLQAQGCKVYATGLSKQTKELHEVRSAPEMALILGNEGSGVRPKIMDLCDEVIKIDMRNIDSLNVATAASIAMYHFRNGH